MYTDRVSENGSLSYFGTTLTVAKKLTKRSMADGRVTKGNLESNPILDCLSIFDGVVFTVFIPSSPRPSSKVLFLVIVIRISESLEKKVINI